MITLVLTTAKILTRWAFIPEGENGRLSKCNEQVRENSVFTYLKTQTSVHSTHSILNSSFASISLTIWKSLIYVSHKNSKIIFYTLLFVRISKEICNIDNNAGYLVHWFKKSDCPINIFQYDASIQWKQFFFYFEGRWVIVFITTTADDWLSLVVTLCHCLLEGFMSCFFIYIYLFYIIWVTFCWFSPLNYRFNLQMFYFFLIFSRWMTQVKLFRLFILQILYIALYKRYITQ